MRIPGLSLNKWIGGVVPILLLLGAGWWLYWPLRLDYGSVKDGIYRNRYFRLSLPVAGWHPADMEAMKWRSEVLRENREPPSEMPPRPPAWKRPAIHLITIYDKPPQSIRGFTASFFVFAEKRSLRPGVRTSRGYLDAVFKEMLDQYPRGRIPDPAETVVVAGNEGIRMRIEWTQEGETFRQEYIAFERRGYFLSLVLTWRTAEERMRLGIPLDSIRFR